MYITRTMTVMLKRWIFIWGATVHVLFTYFRQYLPHNIVRHSLPSLLFMPMALVVTDMVTNSKWSERLVNICCSIMAAIICVEIIAPFYSNAIYDTGDVIAIAMGGVLYKIALDF